MKNLSLLLSLFLLSAQPPLFGQSNVRYYEALGGPGDEEAWKMVKTYDIQDPMSPEGEFIVVGYIQSAGWTHGNRGARDALAVRMRPDGTVIWAEAIGGNFDDEFRDIIYYQGAYYCVGITKSWEQYQKTQNFTAGAGNIFLVKLLGDGKIDWALHFGQPSDSYIPDWGIAIAETTSSGVVLTGVTNAGNPSSSDVVAIRVQPNGAISYAKRYHFVAGSNLEAPTPDNVYDICRDAGLNHILTCGTRAISGPGTIAPPNPRTGSEAEQVSGACQEADYDGIILKTNLSGIPVWATARRLAYNNCPEVGESSVVNLRNNRIYTAGFHSPGSANFPASGELGREYLIYTMEQHTGFNGNNDIPALRRYPLQGSFQQRKRGKLYPRNAYGFYGTLYGATSYLWQLDQMDAVVFALSDSLDFIWQHSFGWPVYYDYINQVLDCTDANDLFCIGGTRSRNQVETRQHNYDLFIARLTHEGIVSQYPPGNGCVATPAYNNPEDGYQNLGNLVVTTDLNSGNCTGTADCWADSNKIADMPLPIDLKNYLKYIQKCPSGGGGTSTGPEEDYPPKVTPIPCDGCVKDLRFVFEPGLLSIDFTISDDFGFQYFGSSDMSQLTTGIKYSDIGLTTGMYHWDITAPHSTGVVEHHQGVITIP